jgi:hypothetical protein
MRSRLETIVNQASWLGARDIATTNVIRSAELERHLNAADTRQMLVLKALHLVDDGCESLIVSLQATMLFRRIPRGKTHDLRLSFDYIPYDLTFEAQLRLPAEGKKSPTENVARWAADHGKLARLAMDRGIDWVTTRFAQTLAESDAQSEAWRRRGGRKMPKASASWTLERGPDGVVNYFLNTRTLVLETTVGPSSP